MPKQNNSSRFTHHSLRIGITGQSGFIGTHLYNYLGLQKNVERIEFKDEFFQNEEKIDKFVTQCDVIVHLAAMNRHNDPEVIYQTNVELVEKLITALERTNSTPHVFISSSTQENKDNLYGKSKRKGRELLIEWSKKRGAEFTGLVIPNVFGPFGNPYYNSFIATFSHRLAHDEKPEIQIDAEIELIYVLDLVKLIFELIRKGKSCDEYLVPPIAAKKVSDVLTKLNQYKQHYMEAGTFPNLDDYFDLCLFNTFRSYIPAAYFPREFKLHTDDRGSFVETVKSFGQGQFSFSTTKPGITRGDHFHIRKIERFAVIKGKARIQLRKIGTEEIINYEIDGREPGYVDMPIWYTHNITNIGEEELITLFWINEFFDPEDPDTYYEKV
ncbi:MAG: NAD-dependent epimerase/dehydratase family protein [Ignavibacteriales bacterium]|nr:NAD-dependent epimerase/dehydratase family protein [Ignavibacteriales bacterium]